MTHGPITARTFLHSRYLKDVGNNEDAMVISEIVEYKDGFNEPRLRIVRSPKVKFWTTTVPNRDHPDKKEFERKNALDEHICTPREKDLKIFAALNDGYTPRFLNYNQRREIYQSPYLYGGSINVEAFAAISYKKDRIKKGQTPHTPTTGFFDIEKSLLPESEGKLPIMTFTAGNKVYVAMLKSFMHELRNGKRVPVTVEDIQTAVKQHIDTLVESIFAENKDLKHAKHYLPFTYEFFVGHTEMEIIEWTVNQMHASKVSFVGIWNLGFDIPEIVKKMEEAGVDPKHIFTDPILRNTPYEYYELKEDKRKVAHFTQKWHWTTTVSHFQFIDSMSLYSYTRTVDGKEASYALDDILKKFGIGGKLKVDAIHHLSELQQADWHREMLGKHFTYYVLYGMWDTMAIQILEWRNEDITAMLLNADTTPVRFYPNQTIKATNTLYERWEPEGWILGTGVDVNADRDDDLLTAGGAVLQPQNLVAKGMKLFKERPDHHTNCQAWLNDFDFSAQYPNGCSLANISKQTKVATMFAIKAPHVQRYYAPDEAVEILCSYLITPNANGVEVGVEFFNLPDYGEISDLFERHLANGERKPPLAA